ncbi:DNA polymerase III subunit delta' [Sediminimonas qiaohouensis]|uniref:DNA polymerase III subunit delta' n=1 Tax=Sediminimonas qiaohouensis TaxID=552061 RepID=UPI000418786C|nr:DNA polymerase III subunit delta' [Sediminimonas qiaohouensis]
MDDTAQLPEPDRIEGAPHPRMTPHLFGQDTAENAFLAAYGAGRLHHGWLITGPAGVGKATLAWSIARFLLAHPPQQGAGLFGAEAPPDTLTIDPDHPVAHRVAALSDPGLFLLRRPYDEKAKRLKQQITVDEVRRVKSFFSLSAADAGRRVVIVDCADEMTTSAANALLKLLEEPPANTTLLLISHQPSRLLPTIRSRCRELRLSPLSPRDMSRALQQAGATGEGDTTPEALAELAGGSVGAALRLTAMDGVRRYGEMVALYSDLPQLDRQRALKLAEAGAARGAEARLDMLIALNDLFLTRMARFGAIGAPPTVEAAPGEAALIARLAPDPRRARMWADLAQSLGARIAHGRAVNLDPASLILDMIFSIRNTAAG